MYKKILLAYNGSLSGQKALLESGELAAWGHAALHLVAVMFALLQLSQTRHDGWFLSAAAGLAARTWKRPSTSCRSCW